MYANFSCPFLLEPPKISLKPQKLIQKAGQQTDFSCILQKGNLPVQFEWLKDGKSIQTSTNIEIDTSKKSSALILQSLTMSEGGNYTCRASNSFGFDQSTSHLVVEGSITICSSSFLYLFISFV